jgi:hypothetical protein
MKKPTLGGTLFFSNGNRYDYCWRESIRCLQQLCDEVVVLEVGSDDGSEEEVKQFEDDKTLIVQLPKSAWAAQRGKTKLAYFTNIAASFLQTDYHYNQQADECLHHDSFEHVRAAIATGQEAFIIRRYNLWGSCYKRLEVPQSRKPCSDAVIRLAKCGYESVDDAENLSAPINNYDWLERIRMYHMGFVRSKHVMKSKIINMQQGVFEMADHDPKLNDMKVFDWRAWFSEEDLVPIDEELPVYVQTWAKEREDINSR